jgi:hypothetical protein
MSIPVRGDLCSRFSWYKLGKWSVGHMGASSEEQRLSALPPAVCKGSDHSCQYSLSFIVAISVSVTRYLMRVWTDD